MGSGNTPISLGPDELKARYKQICQQVPDNSENWRIRVHRSLSWSKRALTLPEDQPEAQFLMLWISLNSLYGRWNAERNMPETDSHARDELADRLCRMDAPAVAAVIQQNRGLIQKLLANPFLSHVFWRDPSNPKSKGWAAEDANHLASHIHHSQWLKILKQTLDRLYVFRGQLVHGASTGGSRLNRSTLRHCLMALNLIVPMTQSIIIEHGATADWPALCYPPIT